MAKIENDKYYTSKELAKHCIEKTKEIIGEENITEYLEPSAGSGVFLDFLDKPYKSYDIEPEHSKIIKQDYLTLELEYKKGRCIIGNPPYNAGKSILFTPFLKRSILYGDYISFILPISQLDNTYNFYEFELIYSEDLGKQFYTDRELHCCFNIYKRNDDGNLNKRPNYKLDDINIEVNARRHNGKGKSLPLDYKYDYAICGFGKGIIGRVPNKIGQYCVEYYFKIKNKKLNDSILSLLKTTDWEEEVCKGISGQCNLAKWQINKYIKEQIPEIN